ncbi:MAG: squalene synthase HpnC [Pirellula sp.]
METVREANLQPTSALEPRSASEPRDGSTCADPSALTNPTPSPAPNSHPHPATPPEPVGTAAERPGKGLVLADLDRFGPDSEIPAMAVDEAFAYCQKLARKHYENFSVTNLWLPRSVQPHFCSIYAYCRWSDDLADETGSTDRASSLLRWWQSELDDCFRDRARHPVFIALRKTISEFDLPKDPFSDLLAAFIQDQSVTRYRDMTTLLDYCTRSANPVGRLVLHLARCATPETVRWSDSICTGLQLANFCQDVPVDARRGRIYLPTSLLEQHGLSDHDVLANRCQPQLASCVESLASQARSMLASGAPLVGQGPSWFARSIQLFVRGGLTILENIAAHHYDVWSAPITVSRSQKIRLLVDACFRPRSQSLATKPTARALDGRRA